MHRLLLSAAVFAALAAPALAQSAPQPPGPRVVVVGEGEMAARPDMAVLSLSVMREAETARAALDANNDAMAAVIAAMKAAGVEDRDLQTSGLSIMPRYVYPQAGGENEQPRIVAYQVVNTLGVRVRDIASVGEIIDEAVTLGVNQGGGIAFTSQDPSEAIAEARRRAVADAMARARTLTEAAGVELGRVIEIAEHAAAEPPRPMLARGMEMAADAAVPIEAGETAYKVQVTVTFEIR